MEQTDSLERPPPGGGGFLGCVGQVDLHGYPFLPLIPGIVFQSLDLMPQAVSMELLTFIDAVFLQGSLLCPTF